MYKPTLERSPLNLKTMDIRRCSKEELARMNEEIRRVKALREAPLESPVVQPQSEQLELWEPLIPLFRRSM
jgi:hypothetical protein